MGKPGKLKEFADSRCPTPAGHFIERTTGEKIPAPCKSWACEVCGPVKKNKLMDVVHLADNIMKSDPETPADRKIWRFLTLTQKTTDTVPIMTAWNRFRATLRKKGITFAFFLVKEFTQKGKRHLHVLVNTYIPGKLVTRAWYHATERTSFIVKIVRRDIKNAAGYMTKYMTKTIGVGQFKKGERRYSSSRRFFSAARGCMQFKTSGRFRFNFNPHISKDYLKNRSPMRFKPYSIAQFLNRGVCTDDPYNAGRVYYLDIPGVYYRQP